MSLPKAAATRVLSAFVALVVVVSAATLRGVAQPAENSDASAVDDEPDDSVANATYVESGENVAGDEGAFGELDTRAYAPNVATANSTYYVRVSESQLNETDEDTTSPYNLTAETKDLDEHDPNENGSTAASLDSSGSVDTVATPYDHDVYAVNLTADANYTVSFEYANASDEDRWYKGLRLTENVSSVTDNQQYGSDSGRMLKQVHSDNVTTTVTSTRRGRTTSTSASTSPTSCSTRTPTS